MPGRRQWQSPERRLSACCWTPEVSTQKKEALICALLRTAVCLGLGWAAQSSCSLSAWLLTFEAKLSEIVWEDPRGRGAAKLCYDPFLWSEFLGMVLLIKGNGPPVVLVAWASDTVALSLPFALHDRSHVPFSMLSHDFFVRAGEREAGCRMHCRMCGCALGSHPQNASSTPLPFCCDHPKCL